MSLLVDGNLTYLARRINVTKEDLIDKYAMTSVDNIIKQEIASGNINALLAVNDLYNSPDKIIEVFKLANAENKYKFLNYINVLQRKELFPMLEKEDLVFGLNFFVKEKLLNFMMQTDIKEVINVVFEALPKKEIFEMFKEEDLMKFFTSRDLKREDVIEQMENLPRDIMEQFIEQVTGEPLSNTNPLDVIKQIEQLPDREYKNLLISLEPEVQLQLVFQLTEENPDYYELFDNKCYAEMLSTLLKPDLVKSMIALNKDTLVDFMADLTPELMTIVLTQIDTNKFAEYLADDKQNLLKKALLH